MGRRPLCSAPTAPRLVRTSSLARSPGSFPMLRLDRRHIVPFLEDADRAALRPRVEAAHRAVLDGSGAGAEMLGWRALVLNPDRALLDEIAEVAVEIRERADVLVCIGIGGSYLGAQAVIEALSAYFPAGDGPEIV